MALFWAFRKQILIHEFIQFFISDAVVAWRAWVLGRESKKSLYVCTACLALTLSKTSSLVSQPDTESKIVTALLIVSARIASLTPLPEEPLVEILAVVQTVNLGVSLMTNVIATGIISLKAW